MSPEEAEQMLSEWVIVTRDRDTYARAAVAAGLSKHRVHLFTGIGRSTIDRILAGAIPGGPSTGHLEAVMITDTRAGTLPGRQSACSGAEARGFEPRMAAKPNRISSSGRGVGIGSSWINICGRSSLEGTAQPG
jgi:hypothetical protein